MSIEFRLGRTDHKVAEEFLAGDSSGVSAIIIDATNVRFQSLVAEAAREAGVTVLVEPLTERLRDPGFEPRLNYADSYPLKLDSFSSLSAKAQLVERVLQIQETVATTFVTPHFYVDSDASLELNIDLASLTAQACRQTGKQVRAILTVSRQFLAESGKARQVGQSFKRAGVDSIDLRLSPLGGEDEGPRKIASTFGILRDLAASGLFTTLGFQGNIGQTALSLGLVDSYSTGIGYREQVNHMAVIRRQKQPPTPNADSFGPVAGVYIPEAAITVPRNIARVLYADTGIRSRLACSLGSCSDSIEGPITDPRAHFLHSRAALVTRTLEAPKAWRAGLEQDRLHRATMTRKLIDKHLPPGTSPLKTRTITALQKEVSKYLDRAVSA